MDHQQNMQVLRVLGHVVHPSRVQQTEQQAMLRIMLLGEEIAGLTGAIEAHQAEIDTHPASPIKFQKDATSLASQSQHPILKMAFPAKKDPIRVEKAKKSGSVHFNSYMKPTRTVREKVKMAMESEQRGREERERQQMQRAQEQKQLSNKRYRHVETKYKQYDQVQASREQAIAARMQEQREREMQGATFSPKTNNNRHISQPFELRLVEQKRRKEQRSAAVIGEVLREQTHKPKLNPHNTAQSRVKQLWLKTPSPVKSARVETEPVGAYSSSPGVQVVSACDLDFMLGDSTDEERLFRD